MNLALDQFLKTAQRLTEVARLELIRLGVVYTKSEPRSIVTLGARLGRTSMFGSLLAEVHAGPISAYQVDIPITELESLFQQLDQGEFSRTRNIHEQIVEFLPGSLRVGKQAGPLLWYYDRSTYANSKRGCRAYLTNGSALKEVLPYDESIDTLIAQESEYVYSSLARIIRAFTGSEIDRSSWSHSSSKVEFFAPWPIDSMGAATEGDSTRVDVEGLTGLDPSRFILNVEGASKDQKLDASTLRWQAAPTTAGDKAIYTTRFPGRDIRPTAVNLYVAGVPDVQLRSEIQQEPRIIVPGMADWLLGAGKPGFQAEARRIDAPEGLRMTGLRASNFRLLQEIGLTWAPPFVVIVGPNQSGKSSVLEALQLLSDAAKGQLSEALVRRRGGLGSLLTRGKASASMTLEVDLGTLDTPAFRYRLSVSPVGTYDFAVADEQLSHHVDGRWEPLLARQGHQASLLGTSLPVSNERESMLSQLGVAHPVIEATRAALGAIAVYPYFRTGAAWADPEAVPMRRPARLEPGARLDHSGDNLAAALFSLRDERPSDWEEYLGIVRLAFPNMKDLRMPAVSRGAVQLFWDDASGQSFDASELSDGTLSFLTILCALFQPGSALIAVDEPEQHLHPDALRRLVGAARSLSDRQPILFTTQSDALIGLLDDAPESVVVANRGPEGSSLLRPEVEQLQEWLKTFSLREMRSELEGWNPES